MFRCYQLHDANMVMVQRLPVPFITRSRTLPFGLREDLRNTQIKTRIVRKALPVVRRRK